VCITKGGDHIGTYNKTTRSYRQWCKTCGGHLFTDHPLIRFDPRQPFAGQNRTSAVAQQTFETSRANRDLISPRTIPERPLSGGRLGILNE